MVDVSPPWPSVLLIGPTGSGKTPLGREIERRGLLGRQCLQFDFGANLRAAAAGRAEEYGLNAYELEAIRASLASGALFEDSDIPMIVKILSRFVEMRRWKPDSLIVLNGLPRHRRQAESLAAVVSVESILSLEADAAVIRERIRLDPGRDRAERVDDDLDAVTRRLAIFRDRTVPLIDFYRERGVPVVTVTVTATASAAGMYGEVERKLQDRRLEELG
jgi:adenylate kinase